MAKRQPRAEPISLTVAVADPGTDTGAAAGATDAAGAAVASIAGPGVAPVDGSVVEPVVEPAVEPVIRPDIGPVAEVVSTTAPAAGANAAPAPQARDNAVSYLLKAAPAVSPPQQARKRTAPRTVGTRVTAQPAFVLHSYPYKETSLIVELLTRDFGRVALIAKGAKRPHSQLRGVLQTFQPVSAGWTGKNELRTLTDADWVGGLLPLEKTALLCGFYLNELLVKLLARDDAHPGLFDHYVSTLNQLAHNEPPPIVLRKFETALLKETGVAADLTRCADTRARVRPGTVYVVDPDRGPRPAGDADTAPRVAGKTLLDMAREDYTDPATQAQSKQLMRYLLAHQLNGAPLNTRQILIDLMQL